METTASTITVYTRSACVQCTATKRKLDHLGVAYETVDLDVDEVALEHVKGLGYLQAPVVEAGSAHWSGYDPGRLEKLA